MSCFIQSIRPFQYSLPISMTGNLSILDVWIRVIDSKNSSIVPNPPGNMTNAFAYFTNMTFLQKKYLKSISFVMNLFGSCIIGTSILRPMEAPPAALAPLFAASIIPGPAPVITARLFLAKSAAVFSAIL